MKGKPSELICFTCVTSLMPLQATLIYSDLLEPYLSLVYSSPCLSTAYSTLSVSEFICVFVFVFPSTPGTLS